MFDFGGFIGVQLCVAGQEGVDCQSGGVDQFIRIFQSHDGQVFVDVDLMGVIHYIMAGPILRVPLQFHLLRLHFELFEMLQLMFELLFVHEVSIDLLALSLSLVFPIPPYCVIREASFLFFPFLFIELILSSKIPYYVPLSPFKNFTPP